MFGNFAFGEKGRPPNPGKTLSDVMCMEEEEIALYSFGALAFSPAKCEAGRLLSILVGGGWGVGR